MEWIEAAIDTTHEGVEYICARLSSRGIEALCIQDGVEFEAHMQKTAPAWELVDEELRARMADLCRVTFFVPAHESEVLCTLQNELYLLPADCPNIALGDLVLRTTKVNEEDWANNWKQYYKPLAIGQRLLVQPAWEHVSNPENRVVFYNNPGMSFGTGEHETTRMCLEQIERLVLGGERVLDIGCGSGILSICALLLGAASAEAYDIDPLATKMTAQNVDLNAMEPERFHVQTANLLDTAVAEKQTGTFDCIFANIVADVVIALVPLIKNWLAPGGVLIASGIIDFRCEEVVQVLCQHEIEVRLDVSRNGWHCLTAYHKCDA